MNKTSRFLVALAALAFLLPSCNQMFHPEAYTKKEKPELVPGSYEYYLYTTKAYPATMVIFEDKELLKKANGKCPIYICLSQQRGRLYVDGKVAADWPVSTGVPGRSTPQGNFRVIDKRKFYASNTYGHIFNAEGKMVKYNADMTRDAVPEGGRFAGSPMPNWMRLTGDGVGMHTGKVRAGKRLSHGCIRTPNNMAVKLYGITTIGTRVTVADAVEACYPSTAAQALADAKKEAQREKDIAASNAARKKQWEADNPRAARKLREQEKAKGNAN